MAADSATLSAKLKADKKILQRLSSRMVVIQWNSFPVFQC